MGLTENYNAITAESASMFGETILQSATLRLRVERFNPPGHAEPSKRALGVTGREGKALSNDLHSSSKEEKLKNSELIKQLSKQHNMCFELEMTLSSTEIDISDLKEGLVRCQKQMKEYLEACERKNLGCEVLTGALETEHAKITQLQLAVESKKENEIWKA
ncbi:uncharacterized protein LOC143248854 isoform X2 [Tachypleus tridentatus]|uniref:uncharacterized protein LOC143248854 isoform X2 n=1 Tax=Tachypleus tridentatus TaxID=6853 RepID=UPI003FD57AE2